jgi:hypothetical protein
MDVADISCESWDWVHRCLAVVNAVVNMQATVSFSRSLPCIVVVVNEESG